MDTANILGGNGKQPRKAHDFYPTPPEATLALLRFMEIPKKSIIWEPAAGDGAMADVFISEGYTVISTDITTGTDFLSHPGFLCDWIITNPPFSCADEFIKHALELDRPFAYLLKSQFWHAAKRRKLFEQYPPDFVLPLTWRPDFTGQGSSLMDVIWCVWSRPHTGATIYKPLSKPY